MINSKLKIKMENFRIVADYREKASGIPELLQNKGVDVELCALGSGDYYINRKIMVERKTKEDFVQSIIANRLFVQCQKMKRYNEYSLLIIEGNPFTTQHKINIQAIKGAILSVSVAWQIPVFMTDRKEETVDFLIMAGKQTALAKVPVVRSGYKPKRIRNRKLWFVQGLPEVGPLLALRLLEKYNSIERVINLSRDELVQIKGIGTRKAGQIYEFVRNSEHFD